MNQQYKWFPDNNSAVCSSEIQWKKMQERIMSSARAWLCSCRLPNTQDFQPTDGVFYFLYHLPSTQGYFYCLPVSDIFILCHFYLQWWIGPLWETMCFGGLASGKAQSFCISSKWSLRWIFFSSYQPQTNKTSQETSEVPVVNLLVWNWLFSWPVLMLRSHFRVIPYLLYNTLLLFIVRLLDTVCKAFFGAEWS